MKIILVNISDLTVHVFADVYIEDVQINFGVAPMGSMVCEAIQCMEDNLCGWTGMNITARTARTFKVKIGPSGGLRGYEHITGKVCCPVQSIKIYT